MFDAALFWSLPGPTAFLSQVVDTAYRSGICAVEAPLYRPPGMIEAIAAAFEAAGVLPVHRVEPRARGSAVQQVSMAAGLSARTMRSVAGFFDLPDLRGSVILVGDVAGGDWGQWSPFVRSFSSERRRRDGMLLPALVVLVPPDIARGEIERLFPRATVGWRGVVSSFDIRAYVQRVTGASPSDDLLQKCAGEVAVHLAGYDPMLADELCRLDPEDAIDPWDLLLERYRVVGEAHPHWSNGMVDSVDDQPFVHTLSLVARGDRVSFDVRRWRATNGLVFDFAGTACRHFADRYAAVIEPRLPFTPKVHVPNPKHPPKPIAHRYAMESKHLRDCLGEALDPDDGEFLRAVASARNHVAHNGVPPASLVAKLSGAWGAYGQGDGASERGWSWPRCGQRLVMTVGPSGGGKSTWAEGSHPAEEIVSTDRIRMDLFGALATAGRQAQVFKEARRRLVARLSRGETAVLDATNLRAADRLSIVDLVPADMEVEYVVLDRPMEDKRRDAGWREEREGLLESHAATFEAELPGILVGDGRANVRVTDRRRLARAAA